MQLRVLGQRRREVSNERDTSTR